MCPERETFLLAPVATQQFLVSRVITIWGFAGRERGRGGGVDEMMFDSRAGIRAEPSSARLAKARPTNELARLDSFNKRAQNETRLN
jgi:hypothetical protein